MKRVILMSCVVALSACASDESTKRPGATAESERSSSGGESTARSESARERAREETQPVGDQIEPEQSTDRATAVEPDDTAANRRDAKGSTLTPMDQKENASDLEITRRVRAAVVGDSELSFTAKNVKIITQNGRITLRGPVKNAAERTSIVQHATSVAGAGQVASELEVE